MRKERHLVTRLDEVSCLPACLGVVAIATHLDPVRAVVEQAVSGAGKRAAGFFCPRARLPLDRELGAALQRCPCIFSQHGDAGREWAIERTAGLRS